MEKKLFFTLQEINGETQNMIASMIAGEDVYAKIIKHNGYYKLSTKSVVEKINKELDALRIGHNNKTSKHYPS